MNTRENRAGICARAARARARAAARHIKGHDRSADPRPPSRSLAGASWRGTSWPTLPEH
eukprot:CAMPEP_0196689122 /NCGR_PEP_ID=MMETSP1090-20130531/17684_1 /TAXON_ID=37098 /ORGANISM="Isochrysis sp, Strain CCMP1244" /LENGTH=58 /DNA_ID=CAMNT_0042028097 /DNA_START=59 /DNA_END=232 /DNA_ORIENTATION=+